MIVKVNFAGHRTYKIFRHLNKPIHIPHACPQN